jgi:hypothetical protein
MRCCLKEVVLETTDFGSANRTPYTSSNITANLGTTPGWHTVWAGLRGLPANAQQTWNAVSLYLDLTPPILVVTNATNVNIPLLQLGGYANEELATLTFDLANANGTITNQPGFMTGAIFDTNSFSYTNHNFRCFDLSLAVGANTVTLHAADRAGNVTTTNFIFTLDYSSKPAPVIQIYWPKDAAQIGASSFTWRGTVDDPSVVLAAEVSDGAGESNVVGGVVERNGNFWVDNMPLFAGTNYLTLTATDIAGNVTSNSIAVVQSDVQMSISAITDDLTQPTVGVSGTINATNYALWVNGVLVTNISASDTNYSWTAYNVPVNGAGCAVVQARAIPMTSQDNNGNGTGGGGGTNSSLSNPGNPVSPDCVDVEMNQDKPPAIVCDYAHQTYSGIGGQLVPHDALTTWKVTEFVDWSLQSGFSSQAAYCYDENAAAGGPVESYNLFQYQVDTNGNPSLQWGGSSDCGTVTDTNMVPWMPWRAYVPLGFEYLQGESAGLCNDPSSPSFITSGCGALSASVHFILNTTGGRSVAGWQNVLGIWANAFAAVAASYPSQYYTWQPGEGLTFGGVPQAATILGQTAGTDGSVIVSVPAGEVIEGTPTVIQTGVSILSPTVSNYTLIHQCVATFPPNQNRTNIGVGEKVNLSLSGSPTGTFSWSCSSGSLTNTSASSNLFTAPDTAKTATVTVSFTGGTESVTFNVIGPTGCQFANPLGDKHVQGYTSAGFWGLITILPTNASFGAIQVWEDSVAATATTGFWTNIGPHPASTTWIGNTNNVNLNYDGISAKGGPGVVPGGFTWAIPMRYRVGSGSGYLFTTNTQAFSADTNGTATISKGGPGGAGRASTAPTPINNPSTDWPF